MKTTLEIPDGLYRQLKMQAAKDGVLMRDVLAEGIQMALDARKRKAAARPRVTSFPLVRAKRGAGSLPPDYEQKARNQEDAANALAG